MSALRLDSLPEYYTGVDTMENEKPNWKAGDLLTTPEVAALLDVTPAWVSELCRQGRVPGAIRRGRFWFIPYEQVDKIKDLPMGRPPKD